MLALRLELPRARRNPGALAPRLILHPLAGQIQPHIDRHVLSSVRQDGEDRHLAVVDLAQPPRPLTGNANRTLPLFDEAGFVDDQTTLRLAADQHIRIAGELGQHRLMVPRRVADEMLKPLRASRRDHRRHPLKRTFSGLGQTLQVALRHRRIVARPGGEEAPVPLGKSPKSSGDPLHQRSRNHPSQIQKRDEPHTSRRLTPSPLVAIKAIGKHLPSQLKRSLRLRSSPSSWHDPVSPRPADRISLAQACGANVTSSK